MRIRILYLDAIGGVVPDAYLKYSEVKGDHGGYGVTSACMDSDVIVLARTKTKKEAEAIAQAVSLASGIPYVPEDKIAGEGFFSARKPPYPNITVELDSTYGEVFDESFLVVGGETNSPEKAKINLLQKYQKLVPRSYRQKRARHICGA